MVVVDINKNVYDVRFYDNNGVDWSEDFFNAGNWNTIDLDGLGDYVYECETDIASLTDYMDDFLNKEGDFVDDETDVHNAYYRVLHMFKYDK